ncbi:MAG TPA: hypothetical protein VFY93_11145 [Planctomycetota bacterium]|nr:hypothetical protein [Planctomycetota bacterium]
MRHAMVARGSRLPVLDFFYLICREGEAWFGRSVRTGHVSESSTFDGAVRNLTLAIAAEIEAAVADGHSVGEWYAAQRPEDERHVGMFLEAIAPKNPNRKKSRTRGKVAVLRAIVAKAAA